MSEMTTILASDVINQANNGQPPVSDNEIIAACPSCGQVPLSACQVAQSAETTYTHMKCGNVLLVIGPPNPDGRPWPGRGYRLGDFVLRNPVDMFFNGVKVPASPHALANARKVASRGRTPD